MDTKPLEKYAPVARRRFIEAVTAQAEKLGITSKATSEATLVGDLMMLKGQPFPQRMHPARQKLVERVRKDGFEAVMEAAAYTWFNRLVAIRYMELHNYLDHGYRVLSHHEGEPRPEILDRVADLELEGLDKSKAVELKLAGTKDEELYRMILVAQGNALHKSMPFLFERLGEVNELLLPANLLYTDSVVRQLVEAIEEEAWQQIEIIGWLYQYYISEKKDQVIGKVVKPEDIPAATQLFTPNWIVKYMVQNSLGAQWLATYPNSSLREQMEYYIEPAEQTPEVRAQLKAITPDSLNPEEITLIDPACGSGHILVEAYDLFKAIYLERGYRQRDIPQLILEKNLYGLDIDQRAAQLAGFALMMKGRADDRRLFDQGLSLNVMAFVNSTDFDPAVLAESRDLKLADFDLETAEVKALKKLFEHATTFGSLIQVPEGLVGRLSAFRRLSEATVGEVRGRAGDMFAAKALEFLAPLVRQAKLLSKRYDNVVANPPYLSSKYHNASLKVFLKERFKRYRSDLFAAFAVRSLTLAAPNGRSALVTPFVWLAIKSYESLRDHIYSEHSIISLVKPSVTSFFESAIVSLVSFVIDKRSRYLKGTFFDLGHLGTAETQKIKLRTGLDASACTYRFFSDAALFKRIPGAPVAFWVSEDVVKCFESAELISSFAKVCEGMNTGDNASFVRLWYEVSVSDLFFGSASEAHSEPDRKWFPYEKGGEFRKWFGNLVYVVNWRQGGQEIKAATKADGSRRANIRNEELFFQPAITWTYISATYFGVRQRLAAAIFDGKGPSLFVPEAQMAIYLAMLCSKTTSMFLKFLNPTSNFSVGSVSNLPLPKVWPSGAVEIAERNLRISMDDWQEIEIASEFLMPSIALLDREGLIETAFEFLLTRNEKIIVEMKDLEERNNQLFIDSYGLQKELSPEVPVEQITLALNPAYRYGVKGTEEERQTRFREDTMKELVSYAVGCMMGRYSLDEPGLIYAHSRNVGFESSRYQKFPADEDGIIPVTDTSWFEDDAAHRLETFLSVAWPAEHLEENLTFLAENLLPNKNESSRDTIRRYLCDKFFTDHCQTYKKRPIYWLFSSGKQKGFQALVYLHRYNEGTLARMRSEYVIPLQGKMAARLELLESDIQTAASTSHRNQLGKEKAKLEKQQTELLAFDEKLRHYADQRIALDLDDGVKVNYGKFGDLLADVKKICGDKE